MTPIPLVSSAPRLHVRATAWPWRSTVAFALPLLLYVLTLAPTVYNLDSAELTTAAATGGIVRATGYPIYLMLGRLWSHLPLGDVGYRMNLLSAVCGAATLLVLDRVLRRWHIGAWATVGALGLLAVAPFFWGLSLVAEVYTLHTLLMALLILLLLRWREQPTAGRLAAAALVVGVGLGHHLAMVLLVPGVVAFVLLTAPRAALRPRSLLLTIGGVLLGLSSYLYLPLLAHTQPTFNYAGLYDATGRFHPVDLSSPAGLWWLVSGRAFAGQMLGYSRADLLGEVIAFGVHLWRAFVAVGIGPALLGIVVLWRRDRAAAVALALMFLSSAAFYINYRVVDKETMFLPTYVVWALWLGVGLQWLIEWLDDEPSRLSGVVLRGAIVLAVIGALGGQFPHVSLAHDDSARRRGDLVLSNVGPTALVVGWWDTAPVVQYLQLVEGQRPDVQTINRFLIRDADLRALIAASVGQRPVYIDSVPGDFYQRYRVRPVGVLYELLPDAGNHFGRPYGIE